VRISTLTTITFVLLQAGYLLAWTTPERVDRRPEGYVVYLHDIAIGRGGTPSVVWSECKSGTCYEKIMFSRRAGDTWTVPLNISRDSGDIRTPAIALDANGYPIVVWSEESYARMRYVHFLGDTWSLPKPCFPYTGITPRLASDCRGRVHLLYEDLASHGGIWYSYYLPIPDSWTTPTRVALGAGELGWSSLAVDRFDHLHAVWMDYGTNGLSYAHNDGAGWSAPSPLPDPAPDDQSCEPRIAVDTLARPHVVWQERSGDYWLYYSGRDADSWSSPRRLTPQSSGPPVVCSDSLSKVYVLYGWYDGLRCIVRTDTAWSAPERISDTTAMQEVASDGRLVHVIWRSADRSLYYSNNGVPGVGEAPSTGSPPVSFRVETPMGLLVVRFSLSATSRVVLSVFDPTGRRALERDLGTLSVGVHSISVDADSLVAGQYIGVLSTNVGRHVTKIVIAR